MSDTGYKNAGLKVNVTRSGSGASWSGSSSSTPTLEYTDWLRAYNFNCSVPTGATIVGIEVKVTSNSTNYAVHRDSSIQLGVGATINSPGDDNADTDLYYLTSATVATYGESIDTWSKSGGWSAANVNDLSVFISVANDGCLTETVSVSAVQVKVWYTTTVVVPTVTTQSVADITDTTATGKGKIDNTGGENCTKRGICWNTTGTPTVSDNKSEETGSFAAGSFSRDMEDLSSGTHYYVRAYAYNSAGCGYGENEVQFDTLGPPVVIPTVTTQATTSITNSTATGNGNITNLGGDDDCTVRGICWSTSSAPTRANNYIEDTGSFTTGAFTGKITGLLANTLYYVRAYAKNLAGYGYTSVGGQDSFTTTNDPKECISGGNYPSLGTEVARAGSTGSWTGETNIYADDASYADWNAAGNGYSPWLKADNFGFAIPQNGIIDGIQVEIKRYADAAAELKDSSLRLAVSGTPKGDDKAYTGVAWPTSDECVAYGAFDNLWGTTWSVADINNIEVYFSVERYAGSGHGFVNYITVRVWYREGAGETLHNVGFFGANF